jgi:GNAT superfamily N-acetyltransferase
MSNGSKGITIVDIDDERSPVAAAAFHLIESTFEERDRQSSAALRSEVEEKRRQLTTTQEYLALAAVSPAGAIVGTITGMYLSGVNAGFVTYLAVDPAHRRGGTGRKLRSAVVERFRTNAAQAGESDLAWVLGEVRITSPWLRRLVRNRGAIPFDLTYFHPGVAPPETPIHALYRQPVQDQRLDLPADLVRQILYAIYRRGYRVRYPLMHDGFRAMLDQLEGRRTVGLHARFAALEGKGGGDGVMGKKNGGAR